MYKRNIAQLSKFRAMCPHDTYLYIYPYVPHILDIQLSFTFLFFKGFILWLKRELMNYVQIQLFWQRQKNYISDIEILKEIHREIREYNDLWTR